MSLIENRKNTALNLLLDPNHQTAIKNILESYSKWNNKGSIDDFVKSCLSTDVFEVIESNGTEIKAIKKISTGEIFRCGDSFWHNKVYECRPDSVENGGYKLHGMWFDCALTGHTFFNGGAYYVNYVRASDGGLYNLEDISTLENAPMTNERKKILLLS